MGSSMVSLTLYPPRPSFSSFQRLLDFLIGIEVRPSAVRPVWQQAQRRDFRCRIRGAPVLGEAAHGGQPRGPLAWLVMGGQCCPLQREFGCYIPAKQSIDG